MIKTKESLNKLLTQVLSNTHASDEYKALMQLTNACRQNQKQWQSKQSVRLTTNVFIGLRFSYYLMMAHKKDKYRMSKGINVFQYVKM